MNAMQLLEARRLSEVPVNRGVRKIYPARNVYGIGDLGDGLPDVHITNPGPYTNIWDHIQSPSILTSTPPWNPGSSSGTSWKDIVGSLGVAWTNIFGAWFLSTKTPGGGSVPVGSGVPPNPATASPNNFGANQTQNGINLFGTNISFGTLLVVGAGVLLLQSRGFEKRK